MLALNSPPALRAERCVSHDLVSFAPCRLSLAPGSMTLLDTGEHKFLFGLTFSPHACLHRFECCLLFILKPRQHG